MTPVSKSLQLKKRTEFNCYLALWSIYGFQGLLYPVGIINQIAQLILIFWSLIAGWNCLTSNWVTDCNLLKAAKLLLLMYIIYGTINLFIEQPHIYYGPDKTVSYIYLQNSINSLLPIFMFMQYSKYGIFTKKELKICFVVFMIMAFVGIIKGERDALLRAALRHSDAEEFQNSAGYFCVAAMPLVMVFRKKLIQFILIFILLGVTVYSMKRGAILTGTICVLLFIIKSVKDARNNTVKVGIIMLLIASLTGETAYVLYQYDNSPYFKERIESTLEGNDSGRTDLKGIITTKMLEQMTLASALLGNGANSTVRFAGNYAHNDWLETISNNGLVGVSILVFFYVSMFIAIKQAKKIVDPEIHLMFQMVFIACLLPTLFSMSVQEMRISITLPIGILCYIQTRICHHKTRFVANSNVNLYSSKIK